MLSALNSATSEKLEELYQQYVAAQTELGRKTIQSLIDFVLKKDSEKDDGQEQKQLGSDTQVDGGNAETAPETSRPNETQNENSQEAAE